MTGQKCHNLHLKLLKVLGNQKIKMLNSHPSKLQKMSTEIKKCVKFVAAGFRP